MSELEQAILDLVRPEVERLVDSRLSRLKAPKPKPWLTTAEAGDYLRITPDAVRKRVAAGTLTAHYDAGGKLRFRPEELDASMQ